jgi:signal transduction protein with GAF and PtsI domain
MLRYNDVGAHPDVRPHSAGVRRRRPTGLPGAPRHAGVPAPTAQEALDRITYLAGEALDVAAVCAALVDAQRRLMASSYGLPIVTALLLSHAFRTQVLATRRPLVVADGPSDPRVAHNPAVRDGTVRACVGMPLGAAGGRVVGTLLAFDQRPRRWTTPQLDLLGELSAAVVNVVEVGAGVPLAPPGRFSPVGIAAGWALLGSDAQAR